MFEVGSKHLPSDEAHTSGTIQPYLFPLECRMLLSANLPVFSLVDDGGQMDTAHPVSAVDHIYDSAESEIYEYVQLNIPADAPASFTLDVRYQHHTYTLQLTRHSLRSKNFKVLVQQADGSMAQIDPGPDRTYRGTVNNHPNLEVSAVLTEEGLYATVTDQLTGEIAWQLAPPKGDDGNARHLVGKTVLLDRFNNALDAEHQPSSPHQYPTEYSEPVAALEAGAAVGNTSNILDTAQPLTGPINSQANAQLLNPVTVKQAEIAFDVSYNAYVNRYGSNTTAVLDRINLFLSGTIEGRLNTIWIRDVLVEHRLGTVVIRTSAATDPYIQQGMGNLQGTDSTLLNAFRTHWNSGVHGNTHDLAHLILGAGGGGLSYVGHIGTSDPWRYSMADGGSKDAWLGYARHEIGHTWGLSHGHGGVSFKQPDGTTGEPTGPQYGIMWDGVHTAMTPLEQDTVFNLRNSVAGELDDIGPFTDFNIRPYAEMDTLTLEGSGPFLLDVLANDFDANNDPLFISGVGQRYSSSFTLVSGSTVSISHGTGDRGQDQILYTPAAGVTEEVFFYRANDGILDNFGQVNVTIVDNTVTVDLDATQYQYDLGTATSPVFPGYQRVTHQTVGDIYWTGSGLDAWDQGSASGANDINRDNVNSQQPAGFHHKIKNGIWRVTLNMGDANLARNNMTVAAEGLTVSNNIDAPQGTYVYVDHNGGSTTPTHFDVIVIDGQLDLDFGVLDAGGRWLVTRINLTRVGDLPGDTTPPVVTVDPLTTSDTTPPITGTIVDQDPNAAIWVTINQQGYAATNHGDGTWSLPDDTLAPLAPGTYDVQVLATDASNNVGSDTTTDELTILAPLPGDLDGDGFVGVNDLNLILSYWNQNTPPAPASADPSGDGFIGINDLGFVLGNWNAGTPPTQQAAASDDESLANATAEPAHDARAPRREHARRQPTPQRQSQHRADSPVWSQALANLPTTRHTPARHDAYVPPAMNTQDENNNSYTLDLWE